MSSGRADVLSDVAPRLSTRAYEPSPLQPVPRSAFAASLFLVVAVIAWRGGEFYAGGADPVVMAKALLTGVALLVAFAGTRSPDAPPLPVAPLGWLGGYLAVATLAALAGGLTIASLILVVRLVVTASVVIVLCSRYGALVTFSALTKAMVIVAGVATVTGIGTLTSGRLSGGIPAATPNEISVLCCVPLVPLLWRWVRGVATGPELALASGLAAVAWLTGSRTGLAVLVLATVGTYLFTRRVSIGAFTAVVVGIPVVAYVALGTSVLGEYVGRGGTQSVTTLSSRTIAWNAALHLADDFWSRWFGAGLALKQIPVPARFWSVQGLDSSWFSALVQVGWFGLALLALWALSSMLRAGRSPYRALWLPLLVLVVLRSLLESGMFDSSPAFLAFLVGAIGASTKVPQLSEGGSDTS